MQDLTPILIAAKQALELFRKKAVDYHCEVTGDITMTPDRKAVIVAINLGGDDPNIRKLIEEAGSELMALLGPRVFGDLYAMSRPPRSKDELMERIAQNWKWN